MNILRKILSTSTLIFLLASLTSCQENKKLETVLDNYVKAFVNQGFFSGSVLVAKDGKILLCKGYGMANYELDVPNTYQTKFKIASITKQFTAMAVLQLQEKGLLHINNTVSKYIPDYPHGDKFTIYNLLTHTAGIPDFTGFPEYKKEKLKPHTMEQMVAVFKNKPLDFKPGLKYKYSNSGYVLLSYIIEKASGKKYETVLKENIFDPLGMKNTGYAHNDIILKNRASGYQFKEEDETLRNATYIDMSVPAGAGGLYSTVEDLYIWDQALYTEKLATKESVNKIFTPFKDGYAFGWEIGKKFNHEFMWHDGDIDGFVTSICRYPDDKMCIIILSNFAHAFESKISHGLAAIVFGEKYELPKKQIAVTLNPEVYDQYSGKYKLEGKTLTIITVTKENNKLKYQASGQKLEFYPKSENEFFHKIIDLEISFVGDEQGKVIKLILHQGGKNKGEAVKIE